VTRIEISPDTNRDCEREKENEMPDLDESYYPPETAMPLEEDRHSLVEEENPPREDLVEHTGGSSELANIAAVVAELAANQELSASSQCALAELGKNLQTKSYKDRAVSAITTAGLEIPKDRVFKPAPALTNPAQPAKEKTVRFPLTDMVKSRIEAAWRTMAGLKGGEDWDPESPTPPPNPVKIGKPIPKPKMFDSAYAVGQNETLSSKPLQPEGALSAKPDALVSIAPSRLMDWEKVLLSSLEVINMLEIFSSSVNQDMKDVWTCLEGYDDLPDDLQQLLARKAIVQANEESKAKALQHVTSYLSWLLAENILVKRDHIVTTADKKLSDSAKHILRLQPFGGPSVFNGKAEEVLKKEAEDKTASVMLKMHQMLSKKPGDTSRPAPSPYATRLRDRTNQETPRKETFRGRGRGQGKPFRGKPQRPAAAGRGGRGGPSKA
jgi:hypothetical protein